MAHAAADPDRLTDEERRDRARLALSVPVVAALEVRLLDEGDPTRGVLLPAVGIALNGAGAVHASTLAATMEAAAYLALLPHLGRGEHAVTHAITLHLLRAAPAGAEVTATGEVDRRTGRLAFVAVVARVGGRPVARAQLVKSVVALPG